MTTNPQLPDDFVDGYWEVVVEELCDLGLSETDARAAAAGYRAYMKPAEWAVYNRQTAHSAKMAHLWLQRHGATGSATPGPTNPPVAIPTPANPSQLPNDFTDGYWEVVSEELCDKYRMSQEDAALAVSLYRQYMIPAGDTIYNDSTHESARMARNRLQQHRQEAKRKPTKASTSPAKPKSQRRTKEPVPASHSAERVELPSENELSVLPRWGRVAFAARCARRVVPLIGSSGRGLSTEDIALIEGAVHIVEDTAIYAAIRADSPIAFIDLKPGSVVALALSAIKLAVAALNSGQNSNLIVQSADEAAEAAAFTTTVDTRPQIRQDFDSLLTWARNHAATDSTPCPPVVAGPLWPDGPPPEWPVSPTPKRFGLTIYVPDEVDLADEREAIKLAAGLAQRFGRLDIVGGGHGLVLKPPLKMSAVHVKARVPVAVGGRADEEPPEPPKAGQIQVTIAVADEQDDASILTAVVQALQGGPVFTSVPDHGTPPLAKAPKGPRESSPKEVVKKAEAAIGDGLRKAAEELLPPGTSPRFDPNLWVTELQTLWNELDGLKISGYAITATLLGDSPEGQSSQE